MISSLFEKYIDNYPGLYLYLTDKMDEPYDYGISDEAHWAHDLYKQMYAKLPGVKQKIEEPLISIINSIEPHRRGIELERTMMNLLVLNAIVDNNYEFFRNTPVGFGKPISRAQFDMLHKLVMNNFPDEKVTLLECELILGDYGKNHALRSAMQTNSGIEAGDPDDFMSELFKREHATMSRVFPGIEHLSRDEFYSLQKIKTGFHFGHMAHAEMTEKDMRRLKELFERGEERFIYQNFVVQLIDVAGSMGHINGRVMLNQAIFDIYVNCVLPSIKMLKHASVEEAYHHYLYQRAALAMIEFSPPDDMSWSETFSLRLLCLLRITEKDEASMLFDVLEILWLDKVFTEDAEFIIDYQKDYQTPTYMPPIFRSLMSYYQNKTYPRKVMAQVVKTGVHIIATALQFHQHLVERNDFSIKDRVNFNKLAHILLSHPEYIDTLIHKRDFALSHSDVAVYPATYPLVVSDPNAYQKIT